MAATQLHRALARPDPMLNFKWQATSIPGPNSSLIDTSYIENFDLPFSNVRTTGVFFGGGYNYFPEFHDTSAFSVTFYGDSEGRAMAYLWGWKQQVKRFNGGLYNLPSKFKDNWKVELLNTKGEVIVKATLVGCWPADTNNVTLDQDGSNRITFSQTFSLDSMELEFVKWGNIPK